MWCKDDETQWDPEIAYCVLFTDLMICISEGSSIWPQGCTYCKEVFKTPLYYSKHRELLRGFCFIALWRWSCMHERPWALPFKIWKIAFHARHVRSDWYCSLSFIICNFRLRADTLGTCHIPKQSAILHQVSPVWTVYECQQQDRWRKTVWWACELPSTESKLKYCSLVQTIVFL